ncbi:hypothetical protein RQP46_006638 [Phenoliferia psychrophenolica]
MHFATITLLSLALNAAAHGLIVEIGGGAKGVAANGFGVANGAAPTRAEVAVLSSKTGCGSGVDIATNIAAAEKAGLPAPATDGSLAMTWFQLNAGSDGGGPGTAFVDPTGTGNSFVALTISKNFADEPDDSSILGVDTLHRWVGKHLPCPRTEPRGSIRLLLRGGVAI